MLIGDPGRSFLPTERMHKVATYDLPQYVRDCNNGNHTSARFSLTKHRPLSQHSRDASMSLVSALCQVDCYVTRFIYNLGITQAHVWRLKLNPV